MTENERLKILQVELGFPNQVTFAKKLGIKQGSLSDIYRMKGGIKVSDSIKRVLEKEYSISMSWLENGEGDIFKQNEPNLNITTMELKTLLKAIEQHGEELRKQGERLDRMLDIIAPIEQSHVG